MYTNTNGKTAVFARKSIVLRRTRRGRINTGEPWGEVTRAMAGRWLLLMVELPLRYEPTSLAWLGVGDLDTVT